MERIIKLSEVSKIITEMVMREMAYPMFFNMEEMLSLDSYSARVRYCQQRLQKIGNGSSRVVFAVDDEKVLKVAKNKKGIAQNQLPRKGFYFQVHTPSFSFLMQKIAKSSALYSTGFRFR